MYVYIVYIAKSWIRILESTEGALVGSEFKTPMAGVRATPKDC